MRAEMILPDEDRTGVSFQCLSVGLSDLSERGFSDAGLPEGESGSAFVHVDMGRGSLKSFPHDGTC